MSATSIDEVLALIGHLDDAPGDGSGREKFRRYLRDNVTDPEVLQVYVNQCLARSEERYVRALQDLINHLGRLLEFEVTFGPYEWLPGQIAFNGRWKSTWGPNIIIEIRKREVYSPYRPTLSRVIEQMIDEGEIAGWHLAVGLYVIARPRVHFTHLEKAILEHVQAHQLRIASLDSLFILAALKHRDLLSHQDVLTVLRSSSPTTNWLIELVSRLAQRHAAEGPAAQPLPDHEEPLVAAEPASQKGDDRAEEESEGQPDEEPRGEPELAGELERIAEELVRVFACFGDCLADSLEAIFTSGRDSEDL